VEEQGFAEIAEEFGLTTDEVRRKAMSADSPEDIKEAEEDYKAHVKSYLRGRIAPKMAKAKGERGNKLRDEKERFTSPKKMATEKEYAQRVATLKEKVEHGVRLTDDELMSVLPRLMR
jgi:hypothetical protein